MDTEILEQSLLSDLIERELHADVMGTALDSTCRIVWTAGQPGGRGKGSEDQTRTEKADLRFMAHTTRADTHTGPACGR